MKDIISILSARLHGGEISAAELTEAYIRAIEKDNPQLNAVVHTTFEAARALAAAADERLRAGDAPPLCGIPMILKDNICTDGLPTTCCSHILDGFRPYYDAAVWEKLKAQGAVLLGKANMDEFAMGSTSETSFYHAPRNPRNAAHVTGGSSGGAAAAVCANLAAFGLGSDTGGSIRQPASYCGIVGLKPTYGAVSRYGLIAYGSSLDQIGPLTQSVSDAAFVFDAIRGLDLRDQTSRAFDFSDYPACLDRGVRGMKIGVADEFFEGIDALMQAQIMEAIALFEKSGAEIVRLSLPALKQALPVYYIIACAEASSNLGRYDGIRYGLRADRYESIDDMIVRTRSEGFGDEVKRRILLGTYVLSSGYYDAYYKKACVIREEIRREFDETFRRCDVLAAPVAPTTAPPLGSRSSDPVEMYLSDICTVPVNIAGLPALSVPCGTDDNGLPVGLQLIGNRFCETEILRVARFYEKSAPDQVGVYEGGVRL